MKKCVSLYIHIPFCALKCKYCDFLSFDGESYSEPVPVMAISDMLLRRRVNGPLHLKYTFNVKQLPKSIFLEAEGRERLCAPITVNGNAITDFTDGAVDKKFLRCDIAPFVQLGENTVIHRITGDGAKRDLIAPLWSADKKRVLNFLNRTLANLP